MSAAVDTAEAREWRELVEWDWVILLNGTVLHGVASMEDDSLDWPVATVQTLCKRSNWGAIPSMGSRMSRKRCRRCCTATGMPQGVGSPKNSDECRPIAEQRVRALQEAAS